MFGFVHGLSTFLTFNKSSPLPPGADKNETAGEGPGGGGVVALRGADSVERGSGMFKSCSPGSSLVGRTSRTWKHLI